VKSNISGIAEVLFVNSGIINVIMDGIKKLRKEVKEYIDKADVKVVKMVHAMLEVERESNWLQDEEILSVVEERSAEYRSGKVKGISWVAAKKQILSSKKTGKK
jgi:flavoprotein